MTFDGLISGSLMAVKSSQRTALLLGLACLIFMLAAWARRESAEVRVEVSSARRELAETVGAVRPSEGRFTGGFDYAPFGGSFHRLPRTEQLDLVIREINKKARRFPTSEVAKDVAILRLTDGDVEEALRILNEEARRHPQRADIQSDLAAVWLARSQISNDPFDFVKALDAADRAVRLDSALPEAWFNLAVAAESLFLPTTVVRAWVSYLSLDYESFWAWEARARLAKARGPAERRLWSEQRLTLLENEILEGPEVRLVEVVRRFTSPMRLWVEDELLPRWAKAEVEKNSAYADRLLGAARRLATQQESITGDVMLRDSLEAIDSAYGSVRWKLARGHQLYGEGRQAHMRHETEKAEELFLQSLDLLKQGGSPFALWSDLSVAICRHEKRDSEGALTRLDDILHQIDPDQHRALAARSRWIRGLALFADAQPTLSLQEFQKALNLLDRTNAPEDQGALHYLIASNLSYLGNRRDAWQHLYEALAATPRTIQERRLFSAYDEAGTSLAKVGDARVSLYFRDEVVALSRASKQFDPLGLEHAYLRRAESRFQVGDTAKANADLLRARRFAERIGSASFRDAAIAEIDVAEGEAAVATSPGRALRLFDSALSYYLQFGTYYDLPRIYLGRYRALVDAGQVEEAALDLAEGIEQYERVRERVEDESSRVSYFDQAQQLFGLMVRLQVEAGRPEAALAYAERARARGLLDLRANARGLGFIGARPLGPAELAARLPEGVTLVEYESLPDRLLAWVICEGRIDLFTLNISRQDLEIRIRSVRKDLEIDREDRLDFALEDLYDRIMRPLVPALKGSLLVIIPDKPLLGLPFAALRDSTTGLYLVESRVISISPSASFYVKGLIGSDEDGLELDPSVLVVGATEFDRTAFSKLSSLQNVESEANAVANVYSSPTLLLGPQATVQRFIAEVGRHDVIHFAGHTVSVPESPLASMMLLSASGSGAGVLRASDLYKLSLGKTRVVVLFSCSTGLNSEESSDGGIGFVRPFLALGADTVIASLWDVRDRRATDLAVAFHRRLRTSRSPSLALHLAQKDLILSGDPRLSSPSIWAIVQVFGSEIPSPDSLIRAQGEEWRNTHLK